MAVWSLGGGIPSLQKQSNLRMTRQREVILEELRKVNTHPSADEVYEMVRKRLPRISLGTVYRNLEILSESGDIQKLEPGCTLKRFDGNPSEHSHIRCIRCDRIECNGCANVLMGCRQNASGCSRVQAFGYHRIRKGSQDCDKPSPD